MASGMVLEDGKIFGNHWQAEDGFEHHQPGRPAVERFEPWQASEEFRILDGVNRGLVLHGFRSVLDRSHR